MDFWGGEEGKGRGGIFGGREGKGKGGILGGRSEP